MEEDVDAVEVLEPATGEVLHAGKPYELPGEEVLQGIVQVDRLGFPSRATSTSQMPGNGPWHDADDVVRDPPERLPRLLLRELVALRAILGNPGLFPERRGGCGRGTGRETRPGRRRTGTVSCGSPCAGIVILRRGSVRALVKRELTQLYTDRPGSSLKLRMRRGSPPASVPSGAQTCSRGFVP